ncbi:MAG TPA: SSI family serine proteinase inhibitor [Streptosporangiaceae bacterium]|jgi:hypothetical protein
MLSLSAITTAGPAHATTSAKSVASVAAFPPPHQGPPGWHSGRWAGADLTITVQLAPYHSQSWRLTCSPNGGTLPNPAQACARLNQAWRPLAPVSHNTMCTTLYFGPQTVTITGWWHGSWVSVRYTRSNGCQETMWNQMVWALGLPNGQVNPGGPMQHGPPPPPNGHGR